MHVGLAMRYAKRMYPHTLTWWERIEQGRDIVWQRGGTLRCRFDMTKEITVSTSGDVANWAASIIIPGAKEPPLKIKDAVLLGAHEQESPPEDAFRITSLYPVSRGRKQADHWEIEAR